MAKDTNKNDNIYKKWKNKHKFSTTKDNKKQFNTVKKVRDDYEAAKMARSSSCYWTTGSDGDGGSWNDRWDLQEKLWLMWYKPSDADDYRSNVKLPETTGRIESTMHKLKNFTPVFNALPSDDEDVDKAKVASIIMNYVLNAAEVKGDVMTWAKNALIHGSGISRWVYMKKEGDYSFPLTDPKKMTDKQKKEVKEGKVIYGKKEHKTKYEGFALMPIPIQEFYVDPDAVTLHGKVKEARYVVWRRIMHIESFKAEFKHNKSCINVDKVKGASSYKSTTDSYEFFKPPQDIAGGDMVEVLEYENLIDDEYIIVANDLQIRNTPLPYFHKEFTFHKTDTISHPNQFYGIGIPDFLENIQAAAEVTFNMMIDKMWRSLNKKYLIESSVYGEFTEGYTRTDSQFIPVSSNDGSSLSSKVQPLSDDQFGFESFNLLGLFGNYATMATQIDPAQMNLQQADRTATATAASRELIEAMLNAIIYNMGLALTAMGKQTWSMIKQKWALPKIKKIVKDGKSVEKKVPRKIRLDGLKVIYDDGKYNVEKDTGDYSFLEINESLLNSAEEYDIVIAPDSLKVFSRAQEVQKMQEAYAQMMPNAVDTSNPEKVAQHPLPLYDGGKLAKKFVKTLELSDELLLDKSEDTEEEIALAKQHVELIMQGKEVAGVPGKSEAHRLVEARVLTAINAQVKNLRQEVENANVVQIDQMTGQQVTMNNPQLEQSLEKMESIQKALVDHLSTENMPRYKETSIAIGQSDAMSQPKTQGVPMPNGGAGFSGAGASQGLQIPSQSGNAPMPNISNLTGTPV